MAAYVFPEYTDAKDTANELDMLADAGYLPGAFSTVRVKGGWAVEWNNDGAIMRLSGRDIHALTF